MRNYSTQKNSNFYEETFSKFRTNFETNLEIIGEGNRLLPILADKEQDIEFLLYCHNLITHKWRSIIFETARHYIDDLSKWCIYYDGSLLHNAVIDVNGKVWLSNPQNFKLGNSKRHGHKLFDVDTDYFLFYKILGKYIFLEKQGLDNQIWTGDMKDLIIELKRTQLELSQYKKGLL